MMVETSLGRPSLVFLLAPARDSYQDHVLAPRFLADAATGLQAVQFGHPNVKQGDFGPEPSRRLDRLLAIVDRVDVMAEEPQHDGETVSGVSVVVRD